MHRLSNRDTLVLRQRTETLIMSNMTKEDLTNPLHPSKGKYKEKTIDEIIEFAVANQPSLAEQPREDLEQLAKLLREL